jgi:hypothetical protein
MKKEKKKDDGHQLTFKNMPEDAHKKTRKVLIFPNGDLNVSGFRFLDKYWELLFRVGNFSPSVFKEGDI